jgi:hypothetical protein
MKDDVPMTVAGRPKWFTEFVMAGAEYLEDNNVPLGQEYHSQLARKSARLPPISVVPFRAWAGHYTPYDAARLPLVAGRCIVMKSGGAFSERHITKTRLFTRF